MNEDLVSLVFILFLFVLSCGIALLKKKRRLLRVYVASCYTLSAACSCIYLAILPAGVYYSDLSLPAMLFYLGAVLLLLLPFWFFPDDAIQTLDTPDSDLLSIGLWSIVLVFLILFIISGTSTWRNLIETWQSSGWVDHYLAAQQRKVFKNGIATGFYSLFAFLGNVLGETVLFLFLYVLTLKDNTFLKISLGACCIFQIVRVLGAAGRNGLVTVSLDIIFLMLLFRKFLSKRVFKLFCCISIGIVLLVSSLVVLISIARFEKRGGGYNSMVTYAGQPLLNFAYYLPSVNITTGGDNTFPLATSLLVNADVLNRLNYHLKWESKLGIPTTIFYSIVGDFVIDYGYIVTLMIFLLFALALVARFRRLSRTVQLHDLFLVYVAFIVVGHGVFYFMQKTFVGNSMLLMSICVYYWLKFSSRHIVMQPLNHP